jgi:hypothetical protein
MNGIQERLENNATIESAIVERKMEVGSKSISLSEMELSRIRIGRVRSAFRFWHIRAAI